MLDNDRSSRFAFILHADIVGSTDLVQRDERIAHDKIRRALLGLSACVRKYKGTTHEVRGDALVAEFEKASDAVCAALAFQKTNEETARNDSSSTPRLRVGIAMGEVVIANRTVTGAGVVLAQRLEQLADPGEVIIQGAACESIPQRMPFDFSSLGEHTVKGFDRPVRAYRAGTAPGRSLPQPADRLPLAVLRRFRFLGDARILASAALLGALIVALAWWQPWRSDVTPASTAQMSHSLPDRPSIAVLPFSVANAAEDNAYIGTEFADMLQTSLSAFPQLFVVAQDSTMVFQGATVELKRIAEDLGVRYVMEGELSLKDRDIRVTARVTDAIEGNVAWDDRFRQSVENITSLRDAVVDGVTQFLAVETDELRTPSATLSMDPVALDFYLRGRFLLRRPTESENARARDMFLKAIDRDPAFAAAFASLASTYLREIRFGWSQSPQTALGQAREACENALALDPQLASAKSAAAELALAQHDPESARGFADQAIELNPGHADAWALLGQALARGGDPAAGLESMRTAMRLNPYPPVSYEFGLGLVLLIAGDVDEARERLQRAVEVAPAATDARILLTAALQLAGAREDAAREAAQLRKGNPALQVDEWLQGRRLGSADVEKTFATALKKAGLPGAQPDVIIHDTGRK